MKDGEDAHEVRRRIRGKTAVRAFRSWEEDMEEQSELEREKLEEVLFEEGAKLIEVEPHVAEFFSTGFERSRKLCRFRRRTS